MHNIFRKKKRENSNHHSNNNVGGHSAGSSHGSHSHGSSGSSHRASSGTKPTNFNYQSLNSHLINGSAASAINNSPVLNIQQHHLSGNGAPSDVNGSRNSSASLFSSLLPSTASTSTGKTSNSECHSFSF